MIEIKNLSKTYKKQKVLDSVHLTIPSGHLFSLMGPNGSGKTTLLKSLLGTVIPDAGSGICINGHSTRGRDDYKAELCYMPQSPQFPFHLKVRELVELIGRLRKQKGPHRERLIDELNIGPFWNKALGELSGGMTQKVNILQCFMFEAPIYILDEPTQGLDPQVAYFLKQWIIRLHQDGKTIVFTSHVMAEVDELADRMALLVEGKLYTVISPFELKRQKNAASLEEALHLFWKTVNSHEKSL
ncbi:MAG: ABC transporter ATP-binding protein [bacterium]